MRIVPFCLFVSTHSRLKAAVRLYRQFWNTFSVSTHSRLKAAVEHFVVVKGQLKVSTHSRLKAAVHRVNPHKLR